MNLRQILHKHVKFGLSRTVFIYFSGALPFFFFFAKKSTPFSSHPLHRTLYILAQVYSKLHKQYMNLFLTNVFLNISESKIAIFTNCTIFHDQNCPAFLDARYEALPPTRVQHTSTATNPLHSRQSSR